MTVVSSPHLCITLQVEPSWVESLNTVLDDNAALSLGSGETVRLSRGMRLIIETTDVRMRVVVEATCLSVCLSIGMCASCVVYMWQFFSPLYKYCCNSVVVVLSLQQLYSPFPLIFLSFLSLSHLPRCCLPPPAPFLGVASCSSPGTRSTGRFSSSRGCDVGHRHCSLTCAACSRWSSQSYSRVSNS
jgi:hypothetical protein